MYVCLAGQIWRGKDIRGSEKNTGGFLKKVGRGNEASLGVGGLRGPRSEERTKKDSGVR